MSTAPSPAAPIPIEDYPFKNLGHHSRKVTTSSGDAQIWFDRGLAWAAGFNLEEARLCYEQAILADPNCLMAHFGLVGNCGPHYNNPVVDAPELAKETLDKAALLLASKPDAFPEVEKQLMKAMIARHKEGLTPEEREKVYTEAMHGVYTTFGAKDPDIIGWYIDSMMQLSPWKLWKDGKYNPETKIADIIRLIDEGLEIQHDHPLMLHQHIHAWEMSPTPEKALPTGKLLRDGLIPDSGHLLHMPSHIDMWIGDYQEAILSNEKAVEADNRYLAARGPANFYTIYRLHDNHLGMAAAMYAGAYSKALKAADEILSLPTGVVAHFPDWLEAMMDNRYHVLMRFGKWDEILETPEPEDKELFCSVIATRLCARAVALASLGRADEAEAERIKFEEALKRIPDTRMLFNNSVANVMAVASKFALGEVRYRQGRYDEAFGALREAVRLSEELIYQEPEAWILPSRHALGALLMEQGHRAEAEQVLRGDLEKHPHNIWSLRGLVNCVEADGRGGSDEAKAWKEELKKLEKIADTEIETPCFCSSMKGAKVHDEAPKAMPAVIQVA